MLAALGLVPRFTVLRTASDLGSAKSGGFKANLESVVEMHQAVRSLKPDDVKNSCLSRHATSPWSPAPAIPIFATFTYVYGCRFNRFRKLYKMMQKQREADKGLMLQALWPVALDSKVPRSNATSMHKVDQQNNTGHCVHGSTTFWIQPEDLAGGKKRQSPCPTA